MTCIPQLITAENYIDFTEHDLHIFNKHGLKYLFIQSLLLVAKSIGVGEEVLSIHLYFDQFIRIDKFFKKVKKKVKKKLKG